MAFGRWLLVKEEDADVLDKENKRITSANMMHGVLTPLPMPHKLDGQIYSTAHATQIRL